ncbi:hypothetical protein V5799_000894 [Amblyomma americanum]|uniref:Thioredoxin domain-containing protein n=2 Tax=Amblyomma americanum TaxID=6943 RepID=A0AAQ4D1R5_AMBAM
MAMSDNNTITSAKELQDAVSKTKDKLLALYFHASWAPQCKQVDDLMPDLTKDKDLALTSFYKVDAEQAQDVSLKYGVSSVPTFVILLNGQAAEKVEGVNVSELVRKLKLLQARVEMPPLTAGEKQGFMQRLQAITARAPCVLLMEGSPAAPAAGESSEAIALLQKAGLKFEHFDITTDSALRQQLIEHVASKAACKYPLLFVNGEFVGGFDEMKRLEHLINKAPVMVFMKGSPDAPRCGFSRTLVEIFKKNNVTYGSFDILMDEDVRQGLKQYSNWPTYPQVYAKGTLVGGLDIIKELEESGELAAALNP